MDVKILVLLFLFQFKHFLADFLFETRYLKGKSNLTEWIAPLSIHSYIHSLFTLFIILLFGWSLLRPLYSLMLSTIEFFSHFIIDRTLSSGQLFGYYDCLSKAERRKFNNPEYCKGLLEDRERADRFFWVIFGIKQLLHNIVYCLIIYLILNPFST